MAKRVSSIYGNALFELAEAQVATGIQLFTCGGKGDFAAVSVPQIQA